MAFIYSSSIAQLDYAFRYGFMCGTAGTTGTAAVPLLLAFFDVVFEPTTGNRYRFTLQEGLLRTSSSPSWICEALSRLKVVVFVHGLPGW